jgi:prepilin-type N-terminal cleavage/methylation domain-containing protein
MKKMKKGFTIVELVIVIGVIAILSAVLIPTFVNLTSKAKVARAQSEVADAYTAYLIEKEDAAKKQNELLAEYRESETSSMYFVYDSTNGWKKQDAKPTTGYKTDAVANDGNASDHVYFYEAE